MVVYFIYLNRNKCIEPALSHRSAVLSIRRRGWSHGPEKSTRCSVCPLELSLNIAFAHFSLIGPYDVVAVLEVRLRFLEACEESFGLRWIELG